MDIRLEKQGKALTVFLRGEIDHHAASSLRQQIDETVISGDIHALTLDFKDVSFMDSSGVGLILGRYKQMLARGGTLKVCRMQARYLAMMKMAGMEKLGILQAEETEHNESNE